MAYFVFQRACVRANYCMTIMHLPVLSHLKLSKVIKIQIARYGREGVWHVHQCLVNSNKTAHLFTANYQILDDFEYW